MPTNAFESLIENYQRAKARLPEEKEITKFDERIVAAISAVREVRTQVLKRISKGQPSELREVWIALEGEDLIRAAAVHGGQEWDILFAEVSVMADAIRSTQTQTDPK